MGINYFCVIALTGKSVEVIITWIGGLYYGKRLARLRGDLIKNMHIMSGVGRVKNKKKHGFKLRGMNTLPETF